MCADRSLLKHLGGLGRKRKLVIASNADQPGMATDHVASEAREAFYRAVQQAVDDEGKAAPSSGPAPR